MREDRCCSAWLWRSANSGARADAVAARKHPGLSAESHTAQHTFRRLLSKQILPSCSKRLKASHLVSMQSIALPNFSMTGDTGALFAHPGFEFCDRWRNPLLPHSQALRGAEPSMARSAAKIASLRRAASAHSGTPYPRTHAWLAQFSRALLFLLRPPTAAPLNPGDDLHRAHRLRP